MANMKKEQVEFLAVLDAIIMALKTSKDINIEELLGNINVSANPFDFLIKIIVKMVGYDEMVKWLVNVLTYSLPVIEVGVKGVLLANLKNMLSCTLDPKIPAYMRKEDNLFGFNNKSTRGIDFNVANIDYKGIFRYHPQSEVGQTYYFGTQTYYTVNGDTNPDTKYYKFSDAYKQALATYKIELGVNSKIENSIIKRSEIDSIYQLARANDFNAFLWFIIHQCNFTNLLELEISKSPYNLGVVSEGDNLTQGQVYYITNDNKIQTTVLSICSKAPKLKIDENGDSTLEGETELIPFSSTNNSGNWYVNRGSYFKYLLPKKEEISRNYEEEFAICNLAYEENNYATINSKLYPYGNLKFTILPAPAIHTPLLKEPPWRIIKFLFNKDGEPDKNGKYSVKLEDSKPNYYSDKNKEKSELKDAKYYGYTVKSIINGTDIGEILVDIKTGKYEFIPTPPNGDKIIYQSLYECYPGLTVYEFNYDFVMGMQLYDPKVIARQLVETTLGVGLGMNISLSTNKTETAYQMRIANVVKEIVEADAYEVSDCFFSFSNEKYDELLNEAEKKRAQGYSFANSSNRMTNVSLDEAYAILNEFNDDATLQENQDVFTRAFNNVTASITQEVLPEDKYNVKLDIITKLIQGLVLALMEVILSPKVVMLFEVNRRLMGGTDMDISFEDFLKMINGLIIQIITELRDMILQMIIDWVLQIIGELADKLRALLLEEQFRFYAELLKRLLQECKINFPLFGHRKLLDSQLDVVDFADIDEVEKPKDSNC